MFKLNRRSTSTLIAVVLACLGCDGPRSTQTAPPVVPAPASTNHETPALDQVLKLSPGAAERLRLLRDKRKLKLDAVVRIAVLEGNFFRLKNGGDKRYRYSIVVDDDPQDLDKYVAMESQGLTIQVPKTSAEFLRGTEIIWIEAGGKGGFQFQNPNQLTDDEAGKNEGGQIVPVEDPKTTTDSPPKTGRTPTPLTDEPSSTPDANRQDQR